VASRGVIFDDGGKLVDVTFRAGSKELIDARNYTASDITVTNGMELDVLAGASTVDAIVRSGGSEVVFGWDRERNKSHVRWQSGG